MMSNTQAIIRSLLVYSLSLPLAIYLGYSLATPDTYDTLRLVGLVLFVLLTPILLRHHHLLLVLSWNTAAVVPLMSGTPHLWLAMAALSLGFSVFNRAVHGQTRFLPSLSVALPLLFLGVVIIVTAKLTGGIGFHATGSEVYGGKRYFLLLGAIIGFFALTAQRIPLQKANLYLAVFILSGVTSVISSGAAMAGPPWQYLMAIFPADASSLELADNNNMVASSIGGFFRLTPLATTGQAIFFFLLAYHGIKGVLDLQRWWRLVFLLAAMILSLLGGFRSSLILMSCTFAALFLLEGLWRTRLLPAILCVLMLGGAILLPMVDKLPLTIQRSLSILPITIDPVARMDAEVSTEWRVRIWKVLLPEIPQYLILGKGFAINPRDIELAQIMTGRQMEASEIAVLAGDYHNGPLSVILPLGIFGVIGFLWFLGVGFWVLWKNFLYGDAILKRGNAFLLASFIAKVLFFLIIYGSFYMDFFQFTGLIGLSISLNGGVSKPVRDQAEPSASLQTFFHPRIHS